MKKNASPLMEIIIFVGVFALCAVILVNLFLVSFYNGVYANDVSSASLKAQSIAENIKKTITIENDDIKIKKDNILYDEKWIETEDTSLAEYKINIDHKINKGKYGALIDIKIECIKINNYPFLNKEKTNLTTISTKVFVE